MEEQVHILEEVEQEVYLESASVGQRFGNLMIDIIGSYIFSLLVSIIVGVIIGLVLLGSGTNTSSFFSELGGGNSQLLLFFSAIIVDIIYYSIFEYATKGRTLGKLITGTRAVNEDGSRISFKKALARSAARFVPFEPLSIFFSDGGPWHDKWTNTKVVRK
ncbi:RDD family protein [Deminuibacter soli]|uniref:RDD family protein n=1 Tax=Deminuibacter soli TaxID=2291815 RepID=A0A3E1NPB0_9BACT|nr:RDD family protein [Deminuibacter soli]RFM29753.1 RDD family protein [Deminuibacter soli]